LTFTLGVCFANAIAIISVASGGATAASLDRPWRVGAAGAYTVALVEKYLGLSLWASLPLAA
jgi:branched-chain amino acid transport system permease protein